MEIIALRDRPGLAGPAARWFHENMGDRLPAGFAFDHDRPDPVLFQNGIDHPGVEEDLHAGFQHDVVAHLLEELRIEADRGPVDFAVRQSSADLLQPPDEFHRNSSQKDMFRRVHMVDFSGRVPPFHRRIAEKRSHETGGRQTAEYAVPLNQYSFLPGASRRHRRRNSPRAATDYDDVGIGDHIEFPGGFMNPFHPGSSC